MVTLFKFLNSNPVIGPIPTRKGKLREAVACEGQSDTVRDYARSPCADGRVRMELQGW